MNLLITICARGGSKGIPGKNIRLLNDVPLLHYSLKRALEFASLYSADIQLSTDNHEIIKCAEEMNYETDYVRPDYLATDEIGKIDVLQHALEYCENKYNKRYDYILDLDVTSPLRSINDLEEAFQMLRGDENALNIFSVNSASRNPYFNMVERNDNNKYVTLVKDIGNIKSRQKAPIVYDMNASFYFYTRKYFYDRNQSSITKRSLVYVMNHVCFDLDHIIDYQIMELLVRENIIGLDI